MFLPLNGDDDDGDGASSLDGWDFCQAITPATAFDDNDLVPVVMTMAPALEGLTGRLDLKVVHRQRDDGTTGRGQVALWAHRTKLLDDGTVGGFGADAAVCA